MRASPERRAPPVIRVRTRRPTDAPPTTVSAFRESGPVRIRRSAAACVPSLKTPTAAIRATSKLRDACASAAARTSAAARVPGEAGFARVVDLALLGERRDDVGL